MKATLADVSALLKSPLTRRGAALSANDAGQPVLRPQPIDAAGELALTWLSVKQLAIRAQGPASGCLVIAPMGASQKLGGNAVWCEVENPKLAFAIATKAFFSELVTSAFGPQFQPEIPPGCTIGPGVVFGPHVVLSPNVTIGPNTVLAHVRIGPRTSIGANCTIGLPGFGYERDAEGQYHRFPHIGDVLIGADVEIGSNTCIDRGSLGSTLVGDGCKIDNLVHIAHNVRLGPDVVVIANSMLGGSVTVEQGAWLAPSTSVLNQLTVGAKSMVGLGAVVVRSVGADAVVVGNPAKPLKPKGEPST